MYTKYWISIWATVIAIIFIFLTSLIEKHATLVFSVEVILLPFIYHIGYEVMMDKQKRGFDRDLDRMTRDLERMLVEREILEDKIDKLKYEENNRKT